MWKQASEWWNVYKYRFVPWLVLHLKKRALLKEEKSRIPAHDLQATVCELVKHLHGVPVRTVLLDPFAPAAVRAENEAKKSLAEFVGFTLRVGKSKLPKAGRGVFVEEGIIQPDTLVALYPGTVYDAGEPVLLQSFGNAYIIQCSDGSLIDGRSRGLSRMIYKSCANRDQFHGYRWCDVSWLENSRMNPYAVGQYVNNECPPDYPANVSYHEFEIPPDFDLRYRKFIPNVHFAPEKDRPLRMMGLVSIRSIQKGEELFSSYFTSV